MSLEFQNDSQGPFVAGSRRTLLRGAVAVSAGLLAGRALEAGEGQPSEHAARKGRIKQSLVHWCYSKYWNVEEMCRLAVSLGIPSIELISPDHWPTLKKHGLRHQQQPWISTGPQPTC